MRKFPWDLALSVIAPIFAFLLASGVGSCPSSSEAQRFRVREPSRAFFFTQISGRFPWRAPKLFGRAFVQGCEKASRSDAFLFCCNIAPAYPEIVLLHAAADIHRIASLFEWLGAVPSLCIASASRCCVASCREAGHSQSGVQRTSPIGAASLPLTVRRDFGLNCPHVMHFEEDSLKAAQITKSYSTNAGTSPTSEPRPKENLEKSWKDLGSHVEAQADMRTIQ